MSGHLLVMSTQNQIAAGATITVAFGDNAVTITLSGAELSETIQSDGSIHRYLSNGSRDFIGTEIEKALISLFEGQPLPLPEHWQAHFQPQAWQRDYAIDVDAEGEQTWDCSAYAAENQMYLNELLLKRHLLNEVDVEVTDNDDVFQDDPAAPEWVRNWSGPFHLTLTRTA